LTKNSPEKGLLADSDNFRIKVESRELRDLGTTVIEKYGTNDAWRLLLRNQTSAMPKRNP